MNGERAERPWGSWWVLDEGEEYKVKRILVRPNSQLSYQSHRHRSEHWVVLTGVAHCRINDVETAVSPGQSVDVPRMAKHRLSNHGSQDLVIIEVQRGRYTGEDDIERFEDDYGRTAHGNDPSL